MQRRRLGSGSLQVSAISLGAMSFGSGFTRETVIDENLAARLVNRAVDAGVNLIDTADTYGGSFGASETLLGKIVKPRRDEILLATKVGYADRGPKVLTYEKVLESCEGSLRRLGVDHIDLYQLHRPDRTVPLAETLGAMENLVVRGLVREIGMSNYRAFEVSSALTRQRVLGRPPISSVQVRYSLAARDVEHEILPQCRADQVGVLVYQPLASGQLTSWQDTAGARGRRRQGILAEPTPELQRGRAAIDRHRAGTRRLHGTGRAGLGAGPAGRHVRHRGSEQALPIGGQPARGRPRSARRRATRARRRNVTGTDLPGVHGPRHGVRGTG